MGVFLAFLCDYRLTCDVWCKPLRGKKEGEAIKSKTGNLINEALMPNSKKKNECDVLAELLLSNNQSTLHHLLQHPLDATSTADLTLWNRHLSSLTTTFYFTEGPIFSIFNTQEAVGSTNNSSSSTTRSVERKVEREKRKAKKLTRKKLRQVLPEADITQFLKGFPHQPGLTAAILAATPDRVPKPPEPPPCVRGS